MKSNTLLSLAACLVFVSWQCTDPAPAVTVADKAVAVPVSNTPAHGTATLPTVSTTARTASEMVAAGFKRYGVEKGALIFRIDGAMKGTEHIYFDNWGWREAKYTRTTADVGSYQERTEEAQYLDGERRYVYDPATNVATFFDSPQVQQAADKWQTKDMVKVGLEMLKGMGGRPDGKGKVVDIECDIWKIDQHRITLHMWQGLTMKELSFVQNIPVERSCVQAKLDGDIPLDKLLLPKGVKEIRMGQ